MGCSDLCLITILCILSIQKLGFDPLRLLIALTVLNVGKVEVS